VATPEAGPDALPQGIGHGYRFSFFNAINFQIAVGTPVILFAKDLGASSTVLGIIASLLPLFTFLQLPAASFLTRYGYRRVMLAGWSLRTVMVVVLSAIPLLSFIDAPSQVALVLFALVVFSVLRGISAGAWMPWITGLLPVAKRGLYLSREQLATHAGSLAALGISAVTLQFLPHPVRYSAIFFLSAMAGFVSLFALRKMPEMPPSETETRSSQSVPWLAMLRFPPFRKLLLFSGLWAIGTNSLGIFTVAFSRQTLEFRESDVVYLTLFHFLGALGTLPFTARWLDAIGIKGFLRLSILLTGCVTFGWMLMAAGVWQGSWWTLALLNLLLGIAYANFTVANGSLVMGVMPVMGRNHFFALYTVITSLLAALAPVLFGMVLDATRHFASAVGEWKITNYSAYFLIQIALQVITIASVSFLKTQEATELNREDFALFSSIRRLHRFLQR
jgi:MFS family permease